MLKIHVVKEAKEAVLYFVQDFSVTRMTIIRPDIGHANLQFIDS